MLPSSMVAQSVWLHNVSPWFTYWDTTCAGSAAGKFPKDGSLPMYFGVAESNGRRNYMQVRSKGPAPDVDIFPL